MQQRAIHRSNPLSFFFERDLAEVCQLIARYESLGAMLYGCYNQVKGYRGNLTAKLRCD
jgi:hypothetical protein